jgi:hypothetical protein
MSGMKWSCIPGHLIFWNQIYSLTEENKLAGTKNSVKDKSEYLLKFKDLFGELP